jgi:FkbM family methyltransferase
MELENYKGIIYRKGNETDKGMIREATRNYSLFTLNEHSVVLDLGTHIGTFAKICADAGVGLYVGYEADPDNYDILQHNLAGGIGIRSAVSWSAKPTLTFTRSQSDFGYCSGTVETGKRKVKYDLVKYEVPNTHFFDALTKWKPTHLKIDIERAELDIIENWLPVNQEQIAIEVHGKKGCDRFIEVHLPQWEMHYDLLRSSKKGSAIDFFFSKKKL